jgi:transcription-repair coupling factor (superfamily II helicase)
MNISSHIPRSYISSDRQRMDVYRRLAVARTRVELDQLERDLFDQFGKPPQSVQDLLQLAEIRILAGPWLIRSIVQKEPDLIFTLDHEPSETVAAKPGTKESREGNLIHRLFSGATGSVRIVDYQTVHLRLPETYFASAATLLSLLRKMLGKK